MNKKTKAEKLASKWVKMLIKMGYTPDQMLNVLSMARKKSDEYKKSQVL